MKKSSFFVVVLLSMVNFNPSFAMDPKLLTFRGAQILAGGFFIKYFIDSAVQDNETLKKPVNGEHMPLIVQQWARTELEKLTISQVDSIPLLLRFDGFRGWAVEADQAIINSAENVNNIESALKVRQELREDILNLSAKRMPLEDEAVNYDSYTERCWLLQDEGLTFGSGDHRFYKGQKLRHEKNVFDRIDSAIERCKGEVDFRDRYLMREAIILKHEASHFINQDSRSKIPVMVCAPLVVQMCSSSLSYGLNRLFRIESPKTWSRTFFRVALAEASMTPKVVITGLMLKVYNRSIERRADEFACQNAESKLQLEEFYSYWEEQKHEFEKISNLVDAPEYIKRYKHFHFDPDHPWLGNRAAMVRKYIDKWDGKHSARERSNA